jgi:hypothetical protein
MNLNANLFDTHQTTLEIVYRAIDATVLLATAVLSALLLVILT